MTQCYFCENTRIYAQIKIGAVKDKKIKVCRFHYQEETEREEAEKWQDEIEEERGQELPLDK